MLREKLNELLKSEFGDSTEIKKDSIEFIKGKYSFTEEKGTKVYWFTTEKASYELICSCDVEVSAETSLEPMTEGENKFYIGNYKIESLKLRN